MQSTPYINILRIDFIGIGFVPTRVAFGCSGKISDCCSKKGYTKIGFVEERDKTYRNGFIQ